MNGKGIGSLLVKSAERLALENGCLEIELQLLYPVEGKHQRKEKLKVWYQWLGYVMGEELDFSKLHPQKAPELIGPMNFVALTKKLRE